ncbi:hypothetical protein HY477_01570, partial [Candidatus Uhrbacteria bacterium]|nr:hypothetical protein [Candidatus Uhrbacteria bacterium]
MGNAGRTFLFTAFSALGAACGDADETGLSAAHDAEQPLPDAALPAPDQPGLPDMGTDAKERNIHPIEWAGLNSSMQLVRDLVERDMCASGWTVLLRDLREEGRGHIVPLQPDYVNYFATVEELGFALADTYRLLGDVLPVTR